MSEKPICALDGCNNEVPYSKWNKQYNKYCSRSCAGKANSRNGLEKRKQTNIEKYGVEIPQQLSDVKEKAKQTHIEKYGEHSSKLESTKEKIKATTMERYGVENGSQSEVVKAKKVETCLSNYGVEYHQQKHLDIHVIHRLNNPKYIIECNETKSLKAIAEDLGVSQSAVYKSAKRLGIDFKHYTRVSSFEDDVVSFLESIGITNVIRNDKTLIGKQEVDIYLPDYELAIECNGVYWHSELQGRGKWYHLGKTVKCKKKNISLIHIWDKDWNLSRELVSGRLSAKLGKNTVIYGRKCVIKSVDNVDQFLQNNHIQGTCTSSVRYGLYYDNELVGVMTFGKSRYSNNTEWELLRYCSKYDINIVGGASKLFKNFVRIHNPESIVSYSDKMWNSGKLYEALGFEFSHSSDPNYFYTRDYKSFHSRVKFQKHKLKNQLETFDENMTEWENMQNNGYDRIWDCGNSVWIWGGDK